MSLSTDEREGLAEAWVKSGTKHGVKIVNHIGASSIVDSKRLAAHAAAVGCVAISTMPPYFFKPASVRNAAEWIKEIAAAAPALPMYYYHFPGTELCEVIRS
jgi:N-acetylneuraminate lyase